MHRTTACVISICSMKLFLLSPSLVWPAVSDMTSQFSQFYLRWWEKTLKPPPGLDFFQPSSFGCLPPWFGRPISVQLWLQTYIFSFPHPILFQGIARKSPPGIAQMKYFSQVEFVANSNFSFAACYTAALYFLSVLTLLIFICLFY